MNSPAGGKGIVRALFAKLSHPRLLATLASGLLLGSLALPLWQMRLEAPQYRDEEALRVEVRADKFRGDLKELATLNQYIGVHVPNHLPQFGWLPIALIAASALGGIAGFLPREPRRIGLTLVATALAGALLFAAAQAKSQMHEIGHKRDQHIVMAGVRDFTPPFLGTAKIAQFEVSSKLGWGSVLIAAALALQLTGALVSRKPRRAAHSEDTVEHATEFLKPGRAVGH